MADSLERMNARAFSRLGKDAVLRGDTPVKVIIERSVALTGEYGEVVSRRDVADMPSSATPKSRDSLQIGAQVRTIDTILEDDGLSVRCVLL